MIIRIQLIFLLSIVSIGNTISQEYESLLNSQDKILLQKNKLGNRGWGTYSFKLDSVKQVAFNFLDTSIQAEWIIIALQVHGVAFSYENGILQKLTTYNMGCIEGFSTEYFPNGKLKSNGQMVCVKRDSLVFTKVLIPNKSTGAVDTLITAIDNHSKKNGLWYYFNDLGKLICTEQWEMGKLIFKQDQ
jgi:antitoxin component YwqK of YwqJK toxin-antitoxin module